MPAKKSIIKTRLHIITVEPRSGCNKIKSDKRDKIIIGLIKPMRVLNSVVRLTEYPAM